MSNYNDYYQLEMLVLDWAEKREIFDDPKPESAALKMVSEIGELADAILEKDKVKTVDAFGDIMVTLINLVGVINRKNKWDLNLIDCLNSAYNVIKDRKGKTVNGTFIREK